MIREPGWNWGLILALLACAAFWALIIIAVTGALR